MPYRLDRSLDDSRLARRHQDAVVRLDAASRDRLAHLGQRDAPLGNGDGGPDVEARGQFVGEYLGDAMPPRIERDDLFGVLPLRERPDLNRREGVGQVRTMHWVEFAGSDR